MQERMHRFWGPVWGAWFFGWVLLEIAVAALPHVFILYWFCLFLPCELQGALKRRGAGDTLSEFVWSFTSGGTARDRAGRLLALALGFRLATLPWLFDGATWAFPEIITGGGWEHPALLHGPLVLVAVGVSLWLYEHFPEEGRTG